MKQIFIRGGVPLNGQVRIQGSKNAALPILAATLLAGGEHEIKNCPKIVFTNGKSCDIIKVNYAKGELK